MVARRRGRLRGPRRFPVQQADGSAWWLSVTDDQGLTDAGQTLGHAGTETDAAGATDSVTFTLEQHPTDTAGATDSVALDQEQHLTDDAGLTDSVATVKAFDLQVADDAGVTDSVTLDRALVVTDAAGFTDAGLALGHAGTETDAAGATDSVLVFKVIDVQATDDAGSTDSVETVGGSPADLTPPAGGLQLITTLPPQPRLPKPVVYLLGAFDQAGLVDAVEIDLQHDPGIIAHNLAVLVAEYA